MSKPAKFTDFEMGWVMATAQAARAGQDILAVEMLASVGITDYWELNGKGLPMFDKKPLTKLLRQEAGRR